MSDVVVIRCQTYDPATVEASLARGLDLLGGAKKFVRPGEPILLKPNLLAPDPPEKCVTTHPAVFRAAARLLAAAGARLSYGDSPGVHRFSTAAEKSGLAAVAHDLKITVADFETPVEIQYPEGKFFKKFVLARAAAAHIGSIVNLPKLKTHGLERLTGAVKNLFGCVPGLLKAEFHVKLPDAYDFARMLVELNLLLKPRLHIMDGIMAMQGNGPRGGTPAAMGVLLLSADPVALDATVARLIGMDPTVPPTITFGQEAGLGEIKAERIRLLGDPLEILRPDHFQADRRHIPTQQTSLLKNRWFKRLLVPRPVIHPAQCTRCGTCVKACPVIPKAVNWVSGSTQQPPAYDYDRCIRCYCCQEMCPEKAIHIRTPLLGWIIRRR